jgi:hypothetical protein
MTISAKAGPPRRPGAPGTRAAGAAITQSGIDHDGSAAGRTLTLTVEDTSIELQIACPQQLLVQKIQCDGGHPMV